MDRIEIPEDPSNMQCPNTQTCNVQLPDGRNGVIMIQLCNMRMSIDDHLTLLHEESMARVIERNAPPQLQKTKIINAEAYKSIAKYVRDFRGLGFDCEIEMLKSSDFLYVEDLTLKSIIRLELKKRDRETYPRYRGNPLKLLKTYEKRAKDRSSDGNLVKLALKMEMGPVLMARLVLIAKYNVDDERVEQLIKCPPLILDDKLVANVKKCIASDISAGPLADLRNRSLKDMFRKELRTKADKLELYYYDEGDKRMADVQMIIPFIFKNELIFWIMSHTVFGDEEEHAELMARVGRFRRRYGAGLIIYWVGFVEDILQMPENVEGILILDDFPNEKDVETLI